MLTNDIVIERDGVIERCASTTVKGTGRLGREQHDERARLNKRPKTWGQRADTWRYARGVESTQEPVAVGGCQHVVLLACIFTRSFATTHSGTTSHGLYAQS